MILITGANGQLGRAIVEMLLKKINAHDIAVSVREPEKAKDLYAKGISVRQGNFNNPETLSKAFEGATTMVLISTSDATDKRTLQHINAIDAAKKAGVTHIIYTSLIHHPGKSYYSLINNHIDTEAHLVASELNYTIIREGLYLDYLPMMLGDFKQLKKIVYPAANAKVSFVLRNDIAEGIVNILTSTGHENKTYNFTHSTAYSFEEISNILSELIETPVDYIDISLEEFAEGMRKYQMPEYVISLSTELASLLRENALLKPATQLEKLLGRKPLDTKDFLKNISINKIQ
jgi:NAD(P)H dehydrogenase (quinone)